ncbi:MAG: Rossmann-like domain-containing protein [Desulfovermiculus sp.]
MKLNQRLYDLFQDKAAQVDVYILSLGLSYTAVQTSNMGLGVAYTYLDNGKSCCQTLDGIQYEGLSAAHLLQNIFDANPLKRSMALALINALNHDQALGLPDDPENCVLFDTLDIGAGTRVAMIGYFGPLMKVFEQRGAVVDVIDQTRKIGSEQEFYPRLGNWADVLFLTSTSILNQSTEEILTHTSTEVRTVMLGPSTPLVPEAFAHLPVSILAGTAPLDQDKVLQAVRNGAGTRNIQQYSRKVYALLR